MKDAMVVLVGKDEKGDKNEDAINSVFVHTSPEEKIKW